MIESCQCVCQCPRSDFWAGQMVDWALPLSPILRSVARASYPGVHMDRAEYRDEKRQASGAVAARLDMILNRRIEW